MKHNPDDRKDNVEKIQRNINNTIRNMEASEELIAKTDDEGQRETLEEKNERRKFSLKGMRNEIRDEANDRENGYR